MTDKRTDEWTDTLTTKTYMDYTPKTVRSEWNRKWPWRPSDDGITLQEGKGKFPRCLYERVKLENVPQICYHVL